MGVADLRQTVTSLWDYAVSDTTLSAYETAVRSFKRFLLLYTLASSVHTLPEVKEEVFLLYIAHCYKTLKIKYSTIKLYLCGIRFEYLKTGVCCPLIASDKSGSSRITALLNAVKRIQCQTTRPRHPITSTILDRICSFLRCGYLSPYTDCLLETACVTAFFGFLRCGEFTINQRKFDPSVDVCLGDVTFYETYVDLKLKSSKTDPFRQGISIPLFKINSSLCPYTALQNYLIERNKKFELKLSPSDPFFLMDTGRPLSRTYFILHIKHILGRLGFNASLYSGHSLRAGAATSGSYARLEDHLIRTLGRWSSDCYRRYIHTPRQVLKDAQSALLAEL